MRTVNFVQNSFTAEEFDYSTLDALKGIQGPTVFIGLGGGGSNAVGLLQRLFQKTFSGKLPIGAGRIPEGYQFLAFDSDSTIRPQGLSIGSEWHQLHGTGLTNGIWNDYRSQSTYKSWLATDVEYSEFATGCQGFRNLGKFLFSLNIAQVYGAFNNAVKRATNSPGLDNHNLNIYFFCTLAGGTGAGCLLDFAFMARNYYPDATIRSFLGCVEGFSSEEGLNDRAKAGTYSALREIDHFMSPTRRSEWIRDLNDKPPAGYLGSTKDPGIFQFPGSVIRGRYDKPFDHCFLMGHENNAGVRTTGESKVMSAFMARAAFSLTAYPLPQGQDSLNSSQTFASDINNANQQLAKEPRGANTCYLVPGMTALHTPAAEVFDLITIECSIRMLKEMLHHGSASDTDRDEAVAFVEKEEADYDSLSKFLGQKLEVHLSIDEDQLLRTEKILRKKKRYTPAGRTQIFEPFNDTMEIGASMASVVSEYRDLIWAETLEDDEIEFDEKGERLTDLTVREYLAEWRTRMIDSCNRELTTPNRRRTAIEDFLDDLLVVLQELQRDALGKVTGARENYERESLIWDNGSRESLKYKLEDLTTDNGFLDIDLRLGFQMEKDYKQHAISAFNSFKNRILSSLIQSLVEEMVRVTEDFNMEMNGYFLQCRSAVNTLRARGLELTKLLYTQEQGRGDTVDTVFSFNVMSRAWRAEYTRREDLKNISTIESIIGDTYTKITQAARAKGDSQTYVWRPIDTLYDYRSEEKNPRGAPLSAFIAQNLCDVLWPKFDSAYDRFTDIREGTGLKNTIEYLDSAMTRDALSEDGDMDWEIESTDESAPVDDSPFKLRAQYLRQKCQPQWDISQNHTALRTHPQAITMLAGPTEVTDALIREGEIGGRASQALSYEAQRISMVSFTYPIGLPGCGKVFSPLASTHDLLMSEEEKNASSRQLAKWVRRKWSCFPESWDWRAPTEFNPDDQDVLNDLFAGLLIGHLFEYPALKTKLGDHGSFLAESIDLYNASADSGTRPKVKSFGIFARGKAIYHTPFVSLNVEDQRRGRFLPCETLGRRIDTAYVKFKREDEISDSVSQWLNWFDKLQPVLFSEEEYAEFLTWAARRIADSKKGLERRSDDYKLWKRLEDAAKQFAFRDQI